MIYKAGNSNFKTDDLNELKNGSISYTNKELDIKRPLRNFLAHLKT
jgi:hypothetical protein